MKISFRERLEDLSNDLAQEAGVSQEKILSILLEKFSLKPTQPVDTFGGSVLSGIRDSIRQ